MVIQPISHHDPKLRLQCIALAEQNYLDNLILLGDLYPPLLQLTKIYGVFDNQHELISSFTIFKGFSSPSVVLPSDLPTEMISTILSYLKETILSTFMLVSFDLTEQALGDFFTITGFSSEQCMYIDKNANLPLFGSPQLKHATENDSDRLDEFYRSKHVYPWNPIQITSGFYCYIELEPENEIIACGGTHFETPRLAQLGNIYVREEYRRQNFGKIITSNVTHQILKKKELATLFVVQDNIPAISLYEQLGFIPYKSVKLFFCENE